MPLRKEADNRGHRDAGATNAGHAPHDAVVGDDAGFRHASSLGPWFGLLQIDDEEREGIDRAKPARSARGGYEGQFVVEGLGKPEEGRGGRIPRPPLDPADLSLLNAAQRGKHRLGEASRPPRSR